MDLVVAVTVLEFVADLIVDFNSSLGHWAWIQGWKCQDWPSWWLWPLRHTFRRVTVHRVTGGVIAYLLIGLTWAPSILIAALVGMALQERS